MSNLIIKLVIAVALLGAAASPSFAASETNNVLKLKEFRKHLQYIKPGDGETRGFDYIFQKKIDTDTPLGEQKETNKMVPSHENGDLRRSFEAKRQTYYWYDFNQDGHDDAIMLFTHRDYCGSIGCSGTLFLSDGNTLKEAGWLTIRMEEVGVGKPFIDGKPSIYAHDECLFWDGKQYEHFNGDYTAIDGQKWTPHACGNHFIPERLIERNDCKTCHHKDNEQ